MQKQNKNVSSVNVPISLCWIISLPPSCNQCHCVSKGSCVDSKYSGTTGPVSLLVI